MNRSTFLRAAVVALLSGFVRIPDLELEEEELSPVTLRITK